MNLFNYKNFSTNSILLLGAVIYFILNLLQSWFSPLIDDEAYYFMWSQHLDWGYFDHPPMIAWWDALGFSLLKNQLGLRLITVLCASIIYYLLGDFLVKNKKDLILYNLLFFSMVLFHVFSFIATPDAPLLFFSILYILVLYHFIKKQTWLRTFSLGACMAMVMYSKYHGALFITFSLLPLIPKFYKNPKAYLAIIIALLLYMPHLIWQINHDFISANYHIVRRNVNNSFKIKHPIDYLFSVFYISSPFIFYYLIRSQLKFPKDLFQRSLWFVFWLSIGFFLLTSFKRYIQAQWSLITVIPLFILGFYYIQNNLKFFKPVKILSLITIGLLMIGRFYFMLPNPPIKIKYHGWEEFMKKAGKATNGNAIFDRYQTTSLYSFYNYPERAYNYVTQENRESQYQLWNKIHEINDSPYTYFSPDFESKDSLLLNSRGESYFKYTSGKKYKDVSNFWFNINSAYLTGNQIIFEGLINNYSDEEKNIRPNDYNIYLILNEKKYSKEINFKTSINFSKINIQPNSSVPFKYIVPVNSSEIKKFKYGYLSLSPKKLPIKIRSNYIKFTSDEND